MSSPPEPFSPKDRLAGGLVDPEETLGTTGFTVEQRNGGSDAGKGVHWARTEACRAVSDRQSYRWFADPDRCTSVCIGQRFFRREERLRHPLLRSRLPDFHIRRLPRMEATSPPWPTGSIRFLRS